jgi:chitinase
MVRLACLLLLHQIVQSQLHQNSTNGGVFVSYVFGSDLADTVNQFGRPNVINLGFGSPGKDSSVSVDDVMEGFTSVNTHFTAEEISNLKSQGSYVLASIGGASFSSTMVRALKDSQWSSNLANSLGVLVNKYGFSG